MILLADSGSTKTTWSILSTDGNQRTCNTKGINPFFMSRDEIVDLIHNEFTLPKEFISAIHFYGTGCALPEKKQVLREALETHFGFIKIAVESDLLGAAHALCQNEEGIACILGTGSNSCYYDGEKIVHNVSPLGYTLGDEGSGAVLGKKLIADILKNQLPEAIRNDFFATYPITPGEILENVYRKPFPNRFLAQYTRFLAKHIKEERIEALVQNSFKEFFVRNVQQYEEAGRLPVHFTGSIAAVFRDSLEQAAHACGFKIGTVIATPLEGLVHYYRKNEMA